VSKARASLNRRKSKSTMKPEPQATEKDLGQDLKTHEALPAKIKELELLQHQAEKTTGPENLALHKTIKDKTKQTAA
jgi:hypothetical protein